ncbi:MAG: competence protein CoiA [Gammaproteobacteria bacterium]|nr:competence protein CoiA [Gammaproteobacteria bacterium]
MILNHKRTVVRDWKHGEESLCPDCVEPLVAKRGEIMTWHWAHKAHRDGATRACSAGETQWHLDMKMAFMALPGWSVEHPVEIQGKKFRLDAFCAQWKAAREFVHTLSESYFEKHELLVRAGYDVLWIMDGSAFVRSRACKTRDGEGYRRMLKPKAYDFHERLRCLAHYENRIWREWKDNVWYGFRSPDTEIVLNAYALERSSKNAVEWKRIWACEDEEK